LIQSRFLGGRSRLKSLGGKILMPKQEVPKIGWFAVYEIPGGVVQAIFQTSRKR